MLAATSPVIANLRVMTRRFSRTWMIVLISLAAAISAAPAQEPQIGGQLQAQQIFTGESVLYTIEISNVENPPQPELSDFDDFDVKFVGQRSMDSHSVSIVNGVRKDSHRLRKVFQFSLTPKRSGKLSVPAPRVQVDGKELVGEPLILVVSGPTEQETVFVSTSVEPAEVYPTQEFTVILQVDVRKLPGTLADRSPLSIQEPVQLTIPWLDADAIPNCTPTSEPQQVVQPLLAARGVQDGFAINGFTVGSNSIFGRPRPAQFVPPSKPVTRTLNDGSEGNFVRYEIRQSFIAERPGQVEISPATIKGIFAVPETEPIEGAKLFAVSNVSTLNISEVPTEGRPASYCGGIGVFEVDSTITPTEAKVGEPMTLTFSVTGAGTLDLIVPPDLERLEGFRDRFRVYQPTSKSEQNRRIFTFTVRPETDAIDEIAAIPFSYFDVEQGEYVSATTAPIPVSISKSTKLKLEEVVSESGVPATEQTTAPLQQNSVGLAANHSQLSAPAPNWLSWKQWCLLWGLIIAGTGCSRLLVNAGQSRNSDPIALRRRQALTNARTALKTAEATFAESGDVAADGLSRLIIGLVADSTGQQSSGMTSTETVATLAGMGISSDIQQQTSNFLRDCDAARYGSADGDKESLLSRCKVLVTTLSKELH